MTSLIQTVTGLMVVFFDDVETLISNRQEEKSSGKLPSIPVNTALCACSVRFPFKCCCFYRGLRDKVLIPVFIAVMLIYLTVLIAAVTIFKPEGIQSQQQCRPSMK